LRKASEHSLESANRIIDQMIRPTQNRKIENAIDRPSERNHRDHTAMCGRIRRRKPLNNERSYTRTENHGLERRAVPVKAVEPIAVADDFATVAQL
jgi:hypothetical protein